jgi:hypothetical protein
MAEARRAPKTRSEGKKEEERLLVEAGREAIAIRDPAARSAAMRQLVAEQAKAFLVRRKARVERLRLKDLNLNFYLLRLVREMQGLETAADIVNYLVNSTLRAGEETAWGWFADLVLPCLFGASTPPEREDPRQWEGYKEIDKEALRPNIATGALERHLISLKSGPLTINDTMAREMHTNVANIQRYAREPVVYGVTYGRRDQLSNKPGIVKGDFGDDRVAILVGHEFWDWLAQYPNAHLDILNGIADGERLVAQDAGVSIRASVTQKKAELTEEFIREYRLDPDQDVWPQLATQGF